MDDLDRRRGRGSHRRRRGARAEGHATRRKGWVAKEGGREGEAEKGRVLRARRKKSLTRTKKTRTCVVSPPTCLKRARARRGWWSERRERRRARREEVWAARSSPPARRDGRRRAMTELRSLCPRAGPASDGVGRVGPPLRAGGGRRRRAACCLSPLSARASKHPPQRAKQEPRPGPKERGRECELLPPPAPALREHRERKEVGRLVCFPSCARAPCPRLGRRGRSERGRRERAGGRAGTHGFPARREKKQRGRDDGSGQEARERAAGERATRRRSTGEVEERSRRKLLPWLLVVGPCSGREERGGATARGTGSTRGGQPQRPLGKTDSRATLSHDDRLAKSEGIDIMVQERGLC